MPYTIEDLDGCTKKLLFNFDAVDLSEQINSALVKKQKEANLKGFRKGKAPLSVIKQFYGPQAENDALYQFISKEYYDAVQKENLRIIGYPQFTNTNYEADQKKVNFEVKVEIFPELELKDHSSYEFTKEDAQVTDEELDNIRKRYLESKAQMINIEDENVTVEKGHTAVINFQGVKEDGERPANMKGEEYLLEIGSGQFIPGFEEGLMGMKKGEKKNLELTFPESYHAEDLKNAKVTFETELLEIKKKELPEFTDEMAKEFGYESVEDFKTKTVEMLKKQKERQAQEKLNQQILEKLIEENSFDVPESLVQQQRQAVVKDITNNLKQQGFNDDMVAEYMNKWGEEVDKKAEFQVRSGLVLDSLAAKFEIEVNDKDLEEKLEEMSQGSGMTPDQLRDMYFNNENIKNNMKYAIREEKTFERLADEMKVK
ncbi:MAG: trigger factor [Bacteriovoracia bacterium]